jgi:phage tail-like protein
MSDTYYPPPSFYFTVTVLGLATPLALLSGVDASFQEISGLQSEFQSEEVVEGGENRYVHRLPKQTKYSNLVLKRGAVSKLSFFAEWFGATIGSTLSIPVLPQNLLVSLLSENGIPLIAWAVVNAYPLKWNISNMNSQDGKVLIETMELSYNYFERLNLGDPLTAVAQLAKVSAKLAHRI